MSLTDKMSTTDTHIKVSLKCARCGEEVKPNEIHNCKEKEKQNG
jgi:DNA-directed RNA polymerase subunit RPC12/RpoP